MEFLIKHKWIVLVGAFVFISLNILAFELGKRIEIHSTGELAQIPSVPSASPRPQPLAQGKQIFEVSGGLGGPISIQRIEVNPYDPQVGTSQIMRIFIKSSISIDTVSLILKTDTKDQSYTLLKKEDGWWEGSWQTEDSHDRKYSAVVTAKSGEAKDTVTLTMR